MWNFCETKKIIYSISPHPNVRATIVATIAKIVVIPTAHPFIFNLFEFDGAGFSVISSSADGFIGAAATFEHGFEFVLTEPVSIE